MTKNKANAKLAGGNRQGRNRWSSKKQSMNTAAIMRGRDSWPWSCCGSHVGVMTSNGSENIHP
ncbi:MAG: hypothetical protein ABFE01_04345 [Phycisphaerales bacterium]